MRHKYRIVCIEHDSNYLVTFSVIEDSFESAIRLFRDKFNDKFKLLSITDNGQVSANSMEGVCTEL